MCGFINAVKGKVLADFPLGSNQKGKGKFILPDAEVPLEKEDTESLDLFTDGASIPTMRLNMTLLLGKDTQSMNKNTVASNNGGRTMEVRL
ncbi:hypothetical protein Tco_1268002 [Tanacetum coccineum]